MLCIALQPCQKSSVILGIKDKGVLKMIWKNVLKKVLSMHRKNISSVYFVSYKYDKYQRAETNGCTKTHSFCGRSMYILPLSWVTLSCQKI